MAGAAPQRSVVHVVRRYGELSQTFVAQVVGEEDRLGWRAKVISQHAPANRAVYPFPPDERIGRPSRPPLRVQLAGRLTGRGPRDRGLAWWAPAIRRDRPSLVHVHFGWMAADVAFERLGIPWLVSFHGSDVRFWPHLSAANRRAYDAMLQALPCATASSNSIAAELRRLGFGGRLEVVAPGVRLDQFEFREALGEAGDIQLLYIGRQVAFKGLDVLIRAMPAVVARHPRVRLVAIGEGEMRAANEALAAELGVARHVEFRGGLPPREVARALAESHVFVVPSRTTGRGEAEGHPVAPKEAMAVGVPVVATASGGLPEVLPPDYRHECAEEGDPGSLAAALDRVIGAPETWTERARVGRAWVEQEFDAARLAERLAGIYGELVEAGARR